MRGVKLHSAGLVGRRSSNFWPIGTPVSSAGRQRFGHSHLYGERPSAGEAAGLRRYGRSTLVARKRIVTVRHEGGKEPLERTPPPSTFHLVVASDCGAFLAGLRSHDAYDANVMHFSRTILA